MSAGVRPTTQLPIVILCTYASPLDRVAGHVTGYRFNDVGGGAVHITPAALRGPKDMRKFCFNEFNG